MAWRDADVFRFLSVNDSGDADAITAGMQHLIFDGTQGLGYVWVVAEGSRAVILAETGTGSGVDFLL